VTAPNRNAQIQQELARRELARRRLLQFTLQTHPTYQAGWVHDDICRRLERFSQQVTEKKSPRLMLLMPPRHGKSELASIRFPAWHLGRNPTHEIINVGYNLDLPMRFSRKVREIFRDPAFTALFPTAKIDQDSQGLEAWLTTEGGGFTAAGRGGGITGKGAHVLIVDDPLKNQEEADSAVTRDGLWDWYLSTAYTRLAPGGGVLVIETWWNDDDLAGRLQAAAENDPEADQFEVVKYPALAEQYEFRDKNTLKIERVSEAEPELLSSLQASEDLELLRKPGEALHTARYDADALKRIRAVQDVRIWSALYQQNPVPDEGMYFKQDWLKVQATIPDPYQAYIYTAWDFAIGEKQTNDYTVGCTLLRDANDVLYLLDMTRARIDTFDIVEAILDTYVRWGHQPGSQYFLGFEDGQIWKSLAPVLRRRMVERGTYPAFEVLKPLTDKQVRARPLQGRMQQGMLVLPEGAPWRKDVEHELLRFPAGKHDDIVDSLAWAVRLTLGHGPPQRRVVQGTKGWKDKLSGHHSLGEGSHLVA
jgi:predicted phage terminase large subunit-like protein